MNNNTADQEKYLYFLDYASLFRMKLIREFLGDIDGRMVVDIGCGNGSVSFLVGFLGANVYSVDVSTRALQETRSLMSHSKRSQQFENSLCQGDAMRLPLRGEIFDILCCLETLQFLPNDRTAIEEMARVMKPGGIVILSVPYDARTTSKEKLPGDQRRYSSKTLKELLCSRQLRLKRVIFWRFPMLELLERIRVRNVFATLGFLIKSLSNKNSSIPSFRNYDAFVHSLLRFYRTRFWRRVALPLLLYTLDLNKLFQNSPCSDDVFLIFRKAHYSEKDQS